MIKVGITGGIGSGKTTVAKIFEVLGIPVYYADEAAKRLMNEDVELKKKLQQEFGQDIYTNGILERATLANMVFNNPEKLKKLNNIVHPATIADADKWMRLQSSPCHQRSSIDFESGAQKDLDYVIGVYAPTAMRIRRAMTRDKITKEDVEARMNKQIDDTIKMRLCDFVITSDEQQLLILQVLAVHDKLCKM
ncbi:MAG: dephospho-CoA kinase [Chitinophagaceae bacterium]|nr:dephospho-CoA kinase [Chitinophagaceae bacterium]